MLLALTDQKPIQKSNNLKCSHFLLLSLLTLTLITKVPKENQPRKGENLIKNLKNFTCCLKFMELELIMVLFYKTIINSICMKIIIKRTFFMSFQLTIKFLASKVDSFAINSKSFVHLNL